MIQPCLNTLFCAITFNFYLPNYLKKNVYFKMFIIIDNLYICEVSILYITNI